MRKSLKTVVALLLTVALMLGVVSTTVLAVSDSTDSQISGSGASSEEVFGGGVTTDWCEVSYDENGITVVLHPTAEALLGADGDDIGAVLQGIVTAIKDVVINSVMNQGGSDGDGGNTEGGNEDPGLGEGITAENIWRKMLEKYVSDTQNGTETQDYINFIKSLLDNVTVNDDGKTSFEAFTDAILQKLTEVVNAGLVDVNALPADTEAIEAKVLDVFEGEIESHIASELANVESYVAAYIAWLTGEDVELDGEIKGFIDGEVEEFVKTKVNAYVENGFAVVDETDLVDVIIADYMDSEIEAEVVGWITKYANGEAISENVSALINAEIGEWVDQVVSAYTSNTVPTNKSPIFDKAYGKIDGILNDKIDSYINAYLGNETVDADAKAVIDNYLEANASAIIYESYWSHKGSAVLENKDTLWGKIHEAMYPEIIKAIQVIKQLDENAAKAYYADKTAAELREELKALKDGNVYGENAVDIEAEVKAEIAKNIADYEQKDWASVWSSLSESERTAAIANIKTAIKSDSSFNAKVADIIKSYWADDKNKQAVIKELVPTEESSDEAKALFASIIETVIDDAEHSDKFAQYKSIITAEINERLENAAETLRTIMLSEIDDAEIEALKTAITAEANNIITEKTESGYFRDKAFNNILGKSEADVIDLLKEELIPSFSEKYLLTLEELSDSSEEEEDSEEQEIDLLELLKLIENVKINDTVLFADGYIDIEAFKQFIFDLPTISEIAEMTDEEMQLVFNFEILTTLMLDPVSFDLTLKVGSGYDEVRDYASKIAQYLKFDMNDEGVIEFHLTVPERFSSLMLSATKSDKIDSELKKKIFNFLASDVEGAYEFIKSFSFDDIIEIFDSAEIDEFRGLSAEEIRAKLLGFKGYYEKIVNLITMVYDNLPDGLRAKSVLSIYDGNGKFSHSGSYEANVADYAENLLTKLSAKYGPLLASFINPDVPVSVAVDFSVDLVKINKIVYKANGTTVGVGFLPAGADVSSFAESEYDGLIVTGWKDSAGTEYTEMPDFDVTLEAILVEPKPDFDGTVTLPDTLEGVYNGADYELLATLEGEGFGAEGMSVEFKWYKNGALLENSIVNPLAIRNATDDDGDVYVCEVIVTDAEGNVYTIRSNESTVKISKAVINLNDYVWPDKTDVDYYGTNELHDFIYDGEEKHIYLVKKSDGTPLTYGVIYVVDENYTNTATNAGSYTASIILDEANAVLLTDEDGTPIEVTVPTEYEWSIGRAKYDMSAVIFNDATVEYNGEEQSITIDENLLPEGITVSYVGNGAIEPGTYTVTAVFAQENPNYVTPPSMEATLRILGFVKNHQYKDSTGKLIVDVVAQSGVLELYKLSFRDVTSQYRYFESDEIFGAGKVGYVIAAYDLHFAENGVKQNVEDTFTVRLLLPVNLRGTDKEFTFIHVSDDGAIEKINAAIDGDYVVFETTGFSIFSMVEVGDAPVAPVETDLTWLWILIAVVVILAIVAVVIIIIIKKRKGKTPEEPAAETEPETPNAPVDEAVAEEAPAEEAPAEEAPAEEAPAEEAPAEEAPAEEAPAEEAPAEEAPAEEAPAEEAPAEEAAAEEAPAEEAPKIIPTPVVIASADGDEDAGQRIINGEVVQVRYRTSFMSRLIQAEESIQDYYTIVKNELLSYGGVKARTSWNFESFNKGRIQCAKLNVKGSAFQVYLGLDPKEYNANKYHFVDVGDKPKLDKVPMLLKVKSERGLKYVLELIEEMMKKFEIEKTEQQNVDYHMPYESTEALAERDLVKIILPTGVTLDGGESFAKVDVGALIETASTDKAEEAPVVHVFGEISEAEIVHVDAVHADEILSDEEAEQMIEHVGKSAVEKSESAGKLCEINLDTICENFEDGDTVTLEALKEKKLISKNAGSVKVLARGVMTKKLTVYADKFSLQAVKMIALAGGHADQYD